ncbi:MAG: hypothetical protein QOK49_383 [Baekduia sp.]|nr:hypothetical protein [Baekduia sp.]
MSSGVVCSLAGAWLVGGADVTSPPALRPRSRGRSCGRWSLVSLRGWRGCRWHRSRASRSAHGGRRHASVLRAGLARRHSVASPPSAPAPRRLRRFGAWSPVWLSFVGASAGASNARCAIRSGMTTSRIAASKARRGAARATPARRRREPSLTTAHQAGPPRAPAHGGGEQSGAPDEPAARRGIPRHFHAPRPRQRPPGDAAAHIEDLGRAGRNLHAGCAGRATGPTASPASSPMCARTTALRRPALPCLHPVARPRDAPTTRGRSKAQSWRRPAGLAAPCTEAVDLAGRAQPSAPRGRPQGNPDTPPRSPPRRAFEAAIRDVVIPERMAQRAFDALADAPTNDSHTDDHAPKRRKRRAAGAEGGDATECRRANPARSTRAQPSAPHGPSPARQPRAAGPTPPAARAHNPQRPTDAPAKHEATAIVAAWMSTVSRTSGA